MDKILERLSRVERTKNGFKSICPSHHDKTASLYISQDEDKILLKCFAGCNAIEIVDSIGLTISDLFTEENKIMTAVETVKTKGKKYKSIEEIKNGYTTIEDIYEYNWEDEEEPSYLQIRYLDKNKNKVFATYHKDNEDGGWYLGKGTGLTPLYNLNNIKDSKAVLIVEGEKVVEMLKKYGIPATTSLGGSNAPQGTDWTPLIGKPSVVMWRDFDDAGLKYQSSISEILQRLGIYLRKVEVEKFVSDKGDDLEQYIEKLYENKKYWTSQEIQGKIYSCFPRVEKREPVSFLNADLEKERNGEIKNLEIPDFPMLTEFGQMFQPGGQVLLYSQPGTGKTLFSGRMADQWVLTGQVRVKRLLLENKLSFHLKRSLAQVSGKLDVMKPKWHYENPEESRQVVGQYTDILNAVGQSMTTSDTQFGKKITDWGEKSILDWIRKNAKDNDVLIIDPISRILNEAPYLVTNRVTAEAEAIMSEFPHLCILWIHHPDSENNVSGGKGWTRFSSSIIEIIKLEEEQMFDVLDLNDDIITMSLDRYIRIRKCRFGEGMDYKLAIRLDKTDLSLKEVGRIIRKVK